MEVKRKVWDVKDEVSQCNIPTFFSPQAALTAGEIEML
jgi:hypothetical protein